jgi:hypothetical protein
MPIYFSPDGGCEEAIVQKIETNMGWLHALLFMYQSEPIHRALCDYAATDQEVILVLDRRQQWIAKPRIEELRDAGGLVYFDKTEKSIRSQYLLSEEAWYFLGSYIYTEQSNHRYAETLLFYNFYDDWELLEANFQYHLSHVEPL